MGAVAAETAFVEEEFLHLPRIGGEDRVALDEGVQAGCSAFPPGQGDMGVVCPPFGLQARGLACPFDFRSQGLQLILGLNTGP